MQHLAVDLLAVLEGEEVGGDLAALAALLHGELLAVEQVRVLLIGRLRHGDGRRDFALQVEGHAVLQDRNAVDRGGQLLLALVKGHDHGHGALGVVAELKVLGRVVDGRVLAQGHVGGGDGVVVALSDLQPCAHDGVEERGGDLAHAAARLVDVDAVLDDGGVLIALGRGALAGQVVDGEFLARLDDGAADGLGAQADVRVAVGVGGRGRGVGGQALKLGLQRIGIQLRLDLGDDDFHRGVQVARVDRGLHGGERRLLVHRAAGLAVREGEGRVVHVKARDGGVDRIRVDVRGAGGQDLRHVREGIPRLDREVYGIGGEALDGGQVLLPRSGAADLVGLLDHGRKVRTREQRYRIGLLLIGERQRVLRKAETGLHGADRLLLGHAAQGDAVDGYALVNGVLRESHVLRVLLFLRLGLQAELLLLLLRGKVLHAGHDADDDQQHQQEQRQEIPALLLVAAAAAGAAVGRSGRT